MKRSLSFSVIPLVRATTPVGRKVLERLEKREPLQDAAASGGREERRARERVARIVEDVRQRGDTALFSWARRLDGFLARASGVEVTPREKKEALRGLSKDLQRAMKLAARRIRAFHEAEKPRGWGKRRGGVFFGQKWTPIEKAGLYVPGGTAAYPSSVLMNAIPAKVAGVRELVMVTPVKKDGCISPVVLAAAEIAGVDRIFKVGGPHAVAALAFGTKTLPKVDKIVGPGNLYVALAKRLVQGEVGIDGFAGPSEVLILADGSTDAAFAAADLLAQAEHDPLAHAVLFTTRAEYGAKVVREVHFQLAFLERRAIAGKALKSRGAVVVFDDARRMLEWADRFAPEHLEILSRTPRKWEKHLHHAGAVFLGPYSAEVFGDYLAGPNHVLPTAGTARFASGLSVFDFLKRVNLLEVNREAAVKLARPAALFARSEGLTAHARSAVLRAKNRLVL